MKRLTKKQRAIVEKAAVIVKKAGAFGFMKFSCNALKKAGASEELIDMYQGFYDFPLEIIKHGIYFGVVEDLYPGTLWQDQAVVLEDLRIIMLLTFAEIG